MDENKTASNVDLFKLRRGQGARSKEVLSEALEAIEAADIERLEALRAKGFNPWRAPQSAALEPNEKKEAAPAEWARAALRDPSGKSLRWLARSFDGFLGDLPICDQLMSHSKGGPFALAPVLAVLDMYRPQGEGVLKTLHQLRQMPQFSDLIEGLLERDWFERYWSTPAADIDEAYLRQGLKNGWDACAEMVIRGERGGMSPEARRGLAKTLVDNRPAKINEKALGHWMLYEAAEGFDIEPALALARLLPRSITEPGAAADFLNKGPQEKWRERLINFFDQRFFGREGEWDLGMCVLLGGHPDSIRCAVEEGWIAPIRIRISTGCENPHYVAYDKARLEAQQGRSLDMSARFEKVERALNASELPAEEKRRWMEALRGPAGECPPKQQWRLSLPASMELSPQVVVMARCVRHGAKQAESAAEVLSEAGFSLEQAAEQASWIGCAQKERRPPWLGRALEKEAIRLASGPVKARAKRSGL